MQQALIKKLSTLLAIILLPILIAVAVYAFIWWKISAAADEFVLQMAPYATVQYTDVHVDLLESEVGLLGLSFVPVGMEGSILLDSAKLKTPSWSDLISLSEKMDKGEIPQSINLQFKGLHLDLQSGYMQDWGRILEESQREAGLQSYDALACGNLRYFTLSDMRKMGYSRFSSDVSMQYNFDAIDKQANFDIQATSTGVMTSSASFSVGVAGETLNVQTLMFAQPQLKRVEMRFADQGYNLRRGKYCADLNKETREQYQARYSVALREMLALEGWTIPDNIYTAFDSLNNPGGNMYMRVDIPAGFGMQSMVLLQSPVDLIDALSPYVEFNSKPVLLDGIAWEQPDPEAIRLAMMEREAKLLAEQVDKPESTTVETELQPSENSEAKVDPVAEETTPEETVELAVVQKPLSSWSRKDPVKSFKKVDLSVLKDNIGKKVRLFTYYGRQVEGELIRVQGDVVTVEHRLVDGRGTATYPIAKDKIQAAEVFY